MKDLVSLRFEDSVSVVTISNPPVNALSPGVPGGLRSSIAAAAADPAALAIVVIGDGRTFIAGADIREFGKVVSGSKSLIHAFFAERGVSKIPDVPKETPAYEIRRAAVIGAGEPHSGPARRGAGRIR
jgi:enoyl-CoA hydratase/carnithine racemase